MKALISLRAVAAAGIASWVLVGCVTIPAEAPELSKELGDRIGAIRTSHLTLLNRFFNLKRAEVDRFIDTEWVPTFASEVFKDRRMRKAWDTIVAENNAEDRLKFLVLVGPKLQEKINEKRVELVAPLDEIERRVRNKLEEDYAEAAAINNTVTSFLLSASELAENRNRYLEMAGVTDETMGNTIDKVDDAIADLLTTVGKPEERIAGAEKYLGLLRNIKNSL